MAFQGRCADFIHARNVPALHELHRYEDPFPEGPDVVHGHHMRMGQLGHGLGFTQRPAGGRILRGRGRGAQQLDRDASVELRVVAGVDVTQASAAQQLQHHVPVQQGSAHQRSPRRERIRSSRGHLLGVDRCQRFLFDRSRRVGHQRRAHRTTVDVLNDRGDLIGLERSGRERHQRVFVRTAHLRTGPELRTRRETTRSPAVAWACADAARRGSRHPPR